ncbi:hypothetical protein CAEBREN_14972 [Caenorhabditis brenneri]|uniref:Uncharacterized protein n=1 Tax=Caenorhabditis brenneri TaxID=135651 RepID=G0MNF9_CAEBE|nr:hypothetical protein CAEBREN_14972 [Caenorhabditis brenneri]
MQNRREVFF